MTKKDLIRNFLHDVKKDYSIPEYTHNSKNLSNKVFYSGPVLDDEEIVEAIDSLLFGKWMTTGEKVFQFEREFSKYINQDYSLMVNSGSSANLVMIAAVKKYFKWNDGDEILISVVGFPTTLNPLIQNNLKPVFVDIEYNTLNFDLVELESKITEKTKGIFISPVLGNPPDMDKLIEISQKYRIELILDGCDSLGSKWNGKHLNEYAVASSCSFYPAHHITTGEGGMVSSNIKDIVSLARSFAWWGRDCYCVGPANLLSCGSCGKRFDKWIEELDMNIDHKYLFTNIGYNLKPLDLQGGMGLVQIKKADEFHQKRKQNKKALQDLLEKYIKGISFPVSLDSSDVSWFGVPIICESFGLKDQFVSHLESSGVQTRNYFAGNILMHPAYTHLEDYKNYPNATNVLKNVFFLGCSPALSEKDFSYIEKVLSLFKEKQSN